jgi:NADPH:quinone reductase-like Zn-dependent oxidoreductase
LGLNGHLAIIGALDGFGGDIQATPLIFSALRASAVMVGSQADHKAVTAFMDEHKIRPLIDSEFEFENAEAAFKRMDEGAFGKIVIKVSN